MAGYRVPGQYIYKGMNMVGAVPPEVLDRIPSFEFRPDDVLIATYPKAGTTWLQQIAWLLMNDMDVETSRKVPLAERSPYLEMPNSGKAGIDVCAELPSPRIIKTHLPYNFFRSAIEDPKKPRFKVIVGMRNVRDVLVSLFHFYKMNNRLGKFDGGFPEFFEVFKNRQLARGDYFEHVLSWWKCKSNSDFHFVKYEDLKKDPSGEIRKIASFLGKALDEKQLQVVLKESNFESMQVNPMINGENSQVFDLSVAKFIRKGKVGDWQNYFTEDQVQLVEERGQKELEPFGLAFDLTM